MRFPTEIKTNGALPETPAPVKSTPHLNTPEFRVHFRIRCGFFSMETGAVGGGCFVENAGAGDAVRRKNLGQSIGSARICYFKVWRALTPDLTRSVNSGGKFNAGQFLADAPAFFRLCDEKIIMSKAVLLSWD